MFGLCINLILFFISLYMLIHFTYRPNKNWRFIFKTITSLLFISTVLISYLNSKCDLYYFKFILCGLIFSLFGDMFLALKINSKKGSLNRKFIYGVLCFSVAHIMYILAFVHMNCFNKMDLNIALLFSLLIIFILNKHVDFKKMLAPVWVYSFIISLMLLESIKLAFSCNLTLLSSTLLLSGTILFAVSDIILSFVLFSKKTSNFLSSTNLLTYYIGQILISLHIYFMFM